MATKRKLKDNSRTICISTRKEREGGGWINAKVVLREHVKEEGEDNEVWGSRAIPREKGKIIQHIIEYAEDFGNPVFVTIFDNGDKNDAKRDDKGGEKSEENGRRVQVSAGLDGDENPDVRREETVCKRVVSFLSGR